MKSKILIALLAVALLSFTYLPEIKSCYLSYKGSKTLTAAPPDRLPKESATPRQLKTADGEVEISVTDGYQILYNNKKEVPFVNLKVELSDPKSYAQDTINLLANLKYLNSVGQDMETKDLIKLSFNSYTIYGLSRNTIEKGSTLGTFVLFPGNNTIVYVYFNNLKPEVRNFEDLTDYKTQRNGFLGNYTFYLKSCVNK
ncbi:MAG TPA: hypothetical protein VNX01_04970 [Bacteroidia bacterium]|jgi:hypothetical protein|nr:hypothetical protein [Bacteroidia bacterium]